MIQYGTERVVKHIRKDLLDLRTDLQLTMKEAADILHVSHPMLGLWERGKAYPSYMTQKKIVLNLDDYLKAHRLDYRRDRLRISDDEYLQVEDIRWEGNLVGR